MILPGRGDEAVEGILGVDAAFDGAAAEQDVFLAETERQTGGDPNLLLDDVDAGDHLRDRVLHLHPGVHLQEVELPVLTRGTPPSPRPS